MAFQSFHVISNLSFFRVTDAINLILDGVELKIKDIVLVFYWDTTSLGLDGAWPSTTRLL